ncbi:FDLD family class I lanthipeptide [Allokutzneria albata]|uniref:Uncharacterized protein n=1 Tax=Allokutzneria albata TaxID=211114 RepID=A0A1G9V5G2_ALLAB|nr:FDLD family class I lanthipeptide [Allokutzneria albata]SDM67379.1 hypothetical protein SAMN04489726_2840 [Allokutzneria albata]
MDQFDLDVNVTTPREFGDSETLAKTAIFQCPTWPC